MREIWLPLLSAERSRRVISRRRIYPVSYTHLTLEGTQKGGVKNSIRNCLTVFQRDPLFRGALRLNLLTEQIDIVKPLGWERTSTTLTDMDMNYLLLYLEENYGLCLLYTSRCV